MRPVSVNFLAALRGSHKAVTRVSLVDPGQTGVTPTGRTLLVIDGSVTVDGTADVRTTAELTLAEPWPTGSGTDQIAPYGSELFVERGIEYGNGVREYVGLGYLRINTVEQEEFPTNSIRVTCSDRMAGLADARLEAPIQFPVGTVNTYGEIVDYLVTAVYPDAVIEWDDAGVRDSVPSRPPITEDDRFGYLDTLVSALGKIWYWAYDGTLQIKDLPDPTEAVFDVDAGPNGVLVSLNRSITRDGVYNAVVASGDALDDVTPPRGVARDDDPESPTYYGGPFGLVPEFFSSSFLVDDAGAAAAAATLLAKAKGRPYSVDFTAIPNVALEPFDPVSIVFPRRWGLDPEHYAETHVLAQLSIPLGPESAMSAATSVQNLGA